MKINKTVALASLVGLFLLRASAILADTPDLTAARATDPNTLGWMVGSPPPRDKLIRFDDGTFYRFPQWRWSFSHWRELRADGRSPARFATAVCAPACRTRGSRRGRRSCRSAARAPMTLGGLARLRTTPTASSCLHRGRIVYERYFGALTAERPHIAFSVTKSFFGTLAAMLDRRRCARRRARRSTATYPSSRTADSVTRRSRQVLDMTTAHRLRRELRRSSRRPCRRTARRPASCPGATADQGPTVDLCVPADGRRRKARTASGFTYRTPERGRHRLADRARHGQIAVATVLSERIWSRIGAEDDAFLQVDRDRQCLWPAAPSMRACATSHASAR